MVGTPIQQLLVDAIGSQRGVEAANRLCTAIAEALDLDAVALSLIFDGVTVGTFGASTGSARMYNEVQFTLGEGPGLDAVKGRTVVAAPDLGADARWPAYAQAMLSHRVHAVYSVPVVVAAQYVGTLDLFRRAAGPMGREDLVGALIAAELAALPVLDLLGENLAAASDDPDCDVWTELGALTRIEVNRATGMLVAQLNIGPAEALARLRAHAYATDRSATDVASDILERRLRLDTDQ